MVLNDVRITHNGSADVRITQKLSDGALGLIPDSTRLPDGLRLFDVAFESW